MVEKAVILTGDFIDSMRAKIAEMVLTIIKGGISSDDIILLNVINEILCWPFVDKALTLEKLLEKPSIPKEKNKFVEREFKKILTFLKGCIYDRDKLAKKNTTSRGALASSIANAINGEVRSFVQVLEIKLNPHAEGHGEPLVDYKLRHLTIQDYKKIILEKLPE